MDINTSASLISDSKELRFKRLINSSRTTYALSIFGILICALFLHYFILSQSYSLTPAETKLLSKTAVDNGQVSFKDGTLSYNQQNQSKDGTARLTVSGATNSTSKLAYRVALASKVSSGIRFSDSNSDLPFKLIPLTTTNNGRYINGHMVYPSENAVGIYTLRRNGIKEDIILNQSPGNSYSYAWKLQLGTQLEARMLPDGGVGIYSANPLLNSSSLQVSDAKSQALIDKAKKAGKKDTLIYVIPAPFITQSNGIRTANNVKFALSGSTLTLTATGLDAPSIHYPISIDPTVVVTTTADFATGYDDGNIDYSTADEIDRAGIGTGLVGTWNYTSNSTNNGATFSAGFTRTRYGHASVVYNGYVYILGGTDGSAGGAGVSADCDTTSMCNGVQYAPINANGTIGAWHYTHSSTDDGTTFVAGFNVTRDLFTSLAYNGYLYVVGGSSNLTSGDCATSCNGVQYAPINANGTVGAWSYTHNSTNDGGTFVAGFSNPRYSHSSVVYNGYMYILGGDAVNTTTECSGTFVDCNGVQFAPINANGTIGAWHYTSNSADNSTTFVAGFNNPREGQTAAAYNGYLYVIGGESPSHTGFDCTNVSVICNGVQYAPINANGTIGAWHFTSNNADNGTTFSAGFTQPRYDHSTVIYNGYMYVIGGASGGVSTSDCSGGQCNGVQFAPINANGTVGAWHFTSAGADNSTTFSAGFNTKRNSQSSIVYNGNVYVLGGQDSGSVAVADCDTSGECSGVQFASLTTLRSTAGPVGTWSYTAASSSCSTWTAPCSTSTNDFTQARSTHTSVAYNGYLYVIGGYDGMSTVSSDCNAAGYCNGVQFAPINANGTIGAWHYTHNSTDDGTTFVAGFLQARGGHTSVINNGYLYVIGGNSTGSTGNDCTSFCNGVQYAPINANGTIGAWNYTAAGSSCATWTTPCSTSTNNFRTGRSGHTSIVSNGYLYVIGGWSGGVTANDCDASGLCNGVQFALICTGTNNGVGGCGSTAGTLGTWNYTHNSTNDGATFSAGFNTVRYNHTSVVYNGYLYVIGGHGTASTNDCNANNVCNGVQFAKLNSDGTVGAWNYTAAGSSCATWTTPCSTGFNSARSGHSSVVYNGYLYILGGNSNSASSGNDCASGDCNGVQFAKINANGTVATWSYTHASTNDGSTFSAGFTGPRDGLTSVTYNGNLYILGGEFTGLGNDCSATDCNGVQFATVSAGTSPSYGTDGTWAYTHNSTNDGATFSAGFTQARYSLESVAYNGYLYVIGGHATGATADCTTAYPGCNGVQYAKINADGTIGTWNYTHNNANDGATFVAGFTAPRYSASAVAYNGFLYVMGGISGASSADCTATSNMCNGVQFAKINNDGTVGTWAYTHNSINDGATFVAGFTAPRYYASAVTYNGFLYLTGGITGASSADCTATSNKCNGVQFAKINNDGTVGTWAYTHNSINDGATFVAGFTMARYAHTAAAYKGYLYILGGSGSSSANDCTATSNMCNGVQFAKINSDGTIGAWNYTSNSANNGTTFSAGFTYGRSDHITVTNNGYLYVVGGSSGSASAASIDCSTSGGVCNGVQYAQINADGTIGTWNYTSNSANNGTTFSAGFNAPRYDSSSVVYNGYLYIIGGIAGASSADCTASAFACNGVQFTSLNSPEKAATYEKIIDLGSSAKLTSLSFNGQAVCGMQINYRVGNSSGSFGSVNTIAYGLPATTYSINQTGRYLWVQFKMDDAACGTNSQVTDFTVTYNVPPAAPTLSSPANSATGVTAMPALQLSTTDVDSDSVQFWIDICSNNTCGSIVRSICQVSSGTGVPGTCTASQTGWNSTTYASGATATYTYQVPALSKNTQYWWRAYAIDPSGSNIWGSASAINTFTTGDDVPAAPTLVYPVSASSGNSVLTTFQLRSTENNSDYLRYWIDVCADSACSSIIRSICQQITGTGVPDGGACTPSQTGWSGQDQQAGTAYSGNPTITLSQLAVHNYQSPYLTKNTTYWWRAYAIDPGGSNTWSASSAIQSFTTAPTETHLQGTIKIQGSVKL